jgi:hypothetical protein
LFGEGRTAGPSATLGMTILFGYQHFGTQIKFSSRGFRLAVAQERSVGTCGLFFRGHMITKPAHAVEIYADVTAQADGAEAFADPMHG